MHGLDTRTAEEACRTCHAAEASIYDTGVHATAKGIEGGSAGCITCHQSHGPGLPPAAGGVNALCESCHPGAMEDVERGGHMALGEGLAGTMNCASCHDTHGTHKPHLSPRVAQACVTCHEKEHNEFAGSTHEQLLESGDINCLSCHSAHKDEEELSRFDAGCGTCHSDVEQVYRGSVHRFGRLRGSAVSATCADCHRGHHTLAADDPVSRIHHSNVPRLCGQCHADEAVITSDFVRLPITHPNYLECVHGKGWIEGRDTAVCTDCHGTHDIRTGQDPNSSINHFRIAQTCSQCHEDEARAYSNSIHGKAVAMGIADSPTCTDCHEEHMIKSPSDPTSRVSPEHIARDLCGDCHTDIEMAAKFGVSEGVVESYLDSYHGWAAVHGEGLVATCVDCHNVHEIRSPLDPASTVHPDNVTETCGRCHDRSNETFARSYTHATALAARGAHGWARLIYIILISVVLGGMALHNLIVARFEMRKYRRERGSEPYVIRWQRAERVQHLALLLGFAGLAITGFALRYPDAWWVKLIGLHEHELLRAYLHRGLATLLTAQAIYHVFWCWVTRRGRMNLHGIAPRHFDFADMVKNMAFHLGLRKERPAFRRFDYTQKAEYWAVVWGTVIMGMTGFVLWFPTIATGWLPVWSVRVAEVVHFYEAILAVSAIFVWHLFYVLFMPSEYPMSTVWLDGRMSASEWKEVHRGEFEEDGEAPVHQPGSKNRERAKTTASPDSEEAAQQDKLDPS
jgi:cytochrome b subunit of formate dehydrogenase